MNYIIDSDDIRPKKCDWCLKPNKILYDFHDQTICEDCAHERKEGEE